MCDRYRNPLRKYDLANSIVCGPVNERAPARIAAAAARAGGRTAADGVPGF